MHFPLIGAMPGAPVDRAREHTSPPQPHPVPVLALKGAVSPLGIGCGRSAGARVRPRCSPRELGHRKNLVAPGESARLGKITAFGPSPGGGRRRFATLHSTCHPATTFLEPRGRGTGRMAPPGSNKRMGAKAGFVPRFCHHDTWGPPSIFLAQKTGTIADFPISYRDGAQLLHRHESAIDVGAWRTPLPPPPQLPLFANVWRAADQAWSNSDLL